MGLHARRSKWVPHTRIQHTGYRLSKISHYNQDFQRLMIRASIGLGGMVWNVRKSCCWKDLQMLVEQRHGLGAHATEDPYVAWLRSGKDTLFEAAGIYWRIYQRGLVPASVKPEPIELNEQQARRLLRKSGALFLRYFTRTCERPTAFWYMACNEYNFENLHRKQRSQIRRAYKDCRVERVDPIWLADNGYRCFTAAYTRYRNVLPESKASFEEMCRGSANGPFEFWGVFVGNELAGFVKCAVGNDYAASVVIKLDPQYMSLSPSSADLPPNSAHVIIRHPNR